MLKKIAIFLLTVTSLSKTFAQTDKHGNPVFNTETISEEKIDDFELTSSYYNIRENISNKLSSVYISDNPSTTDYLKFSRDLPSYAFIVHRGQNVLLMIMLMQKNDGDKTTLIYNIFNPNNKKSMTTPCNVWGEITEKRVDELEKIKADTSASLITLPNGRLYLFNGIAYRIQPYDKMKAEVIEIVKHIFSGRLGGK